LLKQNRNKEKCAYSNLRYLPNVGVRTEFSQPARKKLVLFHGQEDVGVQYTSVPSSLLQGREKMALYCLGNLVTAYSISAVLIAEAIREPVRRKDIEYWL
jgi:hypothetical protein